MKPFALVALALALNTVSGCSRSADPVFYALSSTPGRQLTSPALKIELRRPGLPHTLDRPQIVRHAGGGRLELSALERWAAPLDEMVAAALVDDLEARLPHALVYAEGGAISVSPDVMVEIELSRLEESEEGSAELVAQVAVRWLNPLGATQLTRARLTASTAAADTGALVMDLSALLGRASDSIAEQISEGAPATPVARP